jgi:hypothetical protein
MRSLLALTCAFLCAFSQPIEKLDDSQRILKAFKDNAIIPDVLSLPSLSPPELLQVGFELIVW